MKKILCLCLLYGVSAVLVLPLLATVLCGG